MKTIHKKKLFYFILLILIAILLSSLIYLFNKSNSSISFYVSTYGADNNSGSKAHPFKTLEGARDAIRQAKNEKALTKNITVFLRGGNYFINKSFVLEKNDSANNNLSITYKAYKDEKVFFIGGYNLISTDFKKLEDQSVINRIINKESAKNILVADLSKYPMDLNSIAKNITATPELFFNNNPMTIARYPNDKFASTGQVVNNTNTPAFSFKYNEIEPSLWSKDQTIWMSGYWNYNWSYSNVKVSNIDTKNNLINFTDKLPYGLKEGQRFYFYNVLEELDAPGEYYIDYSKKLLYFLPSATLKNSKIQLSKLTEPFIKMEDVSNITIEGIVFEDSKAIDIVLENGSNNKIKNCVIRNTSQNGVSINGGFNNGIENCTIYNTGQGGVFINGGDRNTLTPCNNYVTNNELYNYSRIDKPTTGIKISGVGIIASHNSIHDAPHTAITFGGNDNIMEYNEIYNVATETDDVGAIYAGRDWTFRGNIIRYNYLHNIDNNIVNSKINGVYLDDCMSSAEVYGNVFYKVKTPILIGGGRDNIVENNIIADCKNSIIFDDRGLSWNPNTILPQLYENLKKVPYEDPTWTNKYPELKSILKDDKPGNPNNNIIKSNVLYKTKVPSISDSVIKNGNVTNNISYDKDPGFVNLEKKDFRLSKDSIIFKQIKDFKNIPFEDIGIKH